MSGKKKQSEEIPEKQQNQGEQNMDAVDETLMPPYQNNVVITEEQTAAEEPGAENKIELLMQELEEQKRIAAENLDKALRVQAELENMRKRTARDIENAHKYSLERFVTDLLPVIDSMELGLSASENGADVASLKEGMDLTFKIFTASLEKFGAKVINPQDEKFNPELHQAVTVLEAEGVASGHVISVMQKGYELNGRLVRPAMVVVAK
ncbi:MAG: nucleotide exchange factor GrpE [Gammaproteobacteria bacterium RIFCSPLOWO2_12_47_11]|nr:MAG: nucleotide exchange factor GrpE [Gammaproteobacteria bacterium RIFCSPLOWO2_12_47_11]